MCACGGSHITHSSLPSPSSPAPPCRAGFWHLDRLSSMKFLIENAFQPPAFLGILQDNSCGLPNSHLHKPLLLQACCGLSRPTLTCCSAPWQNKAKPQATESKQCLQRDLQPGTFAGASAWEMLCREQLFSSASPTCVSQRLLEPVH